VEKPILRDYLPREIQGGDFVTNLPERRKEACSKRKVNIEGGGGKKFLVKDLKTNPERGNYARRHPGRGGFTSLFLGSKTGKILNKNSRNTRIDYSWPKESRGSGEEGGESLLNE